MEALSLLGGLLKWLYKGLLGYGVIISVVVSAVTNLWLIYASAVPVALNALAKLTTVCASVSQKAVILQTIVNDNTWLKFFLYVINWELLSEVLIDLSAVAIVTLGIYWALLSATLVYSIAMVGVRWTARIIKALSLSLVDVTT